MPPNINPIVDRPDREIVYPESDGKPMADNTKQARWITLLYGSLEGLFADDPNVFVAADNLWYPVQGEPNISAAPDVYVVFGRPKGDRTSYFQWREDDIPLTVVFEILSPSNKSMEMIDKHSFYDLYGVQEYYLYDPDSDRLVIYVRGVETLRRVYPGESFRSPRLGILFDLSGKELVVRYADGEPFIWAGEEHKQRRAAQEQAQLERVRAEKERARANSVQQSMARLRELSRKARRGEASAEELAELDRLETADPIEDLSA